MQQMQSQILNVAKKNKKSVIVLIVCVFFLFFLCITNTDKQQNNSESDQDVINELEKTFEMKIESFLKNVDGVGKVKVCVTFDTLMQYEYAQDIQSDSSEEDYETTQEFVIIEKQDGSEIGLCLVVTAPKIRGIAVCCEGGNSMKVKNEVTQLLAAAFAIPANRIHVAAYYTDN